MRERREGVMLQSHAPVNRRCVEPKPDGLADGRSPRYGPVEEFEGIVSETLMRTLDKRTGATRLMWRKINARKRTARRAGLQRSRLSLTWAWASCSHEGNAIAIAAGRKEAA